MKIFEKLWRNGAWPWSTPTTVPGASYEFHCHSCRTPVGDADEICPTCGEKLRT